MKTKFDSTREKLEYLETRRLLIESAQLKDLINIEEFDALFDIARSTQSKYRMSTHKPKPLPYHKVGHKTILYNKVEVAKWVVEQTNK